MKYIKILSLILISSFINNSFGYSEIEYLQHLIQTEKIGSVKNLILTKSIISSKCKNKLLKTASEKLQHILDEKRNRNLETEHRERLYELSTEYQSLINILKHYAP